MGRTQKCRACLTENTEGANYCSQCGAKLGGPLGVQARSSGAPPEAGERRLVTIMFADIAGFSTLAGQMEPEGLRELTTACFETLVPVIERYGGTVHQFVGDEIMALFGAPVAHDDDPERAVRCAVELMEALSAMSAGGGPGLRLHVGICAGRVFAGEVDVRGRHEYSVMGDAVNLAARLRAEARAGEILIGPEIERRTRHIARCDPAGSLRLKGKSRPVRAYKLLGLSPTHTQASTRGLSSALVGRLSQRATLLRACEDLAEGRGAIVSVSAEAGVGKSRLLAEVRRSPEAQRSRWLEGRCLSYGEGLSYRPFLDVLEQDAGCVLADTEEQRREKVFGRAGELFADEAEELIPYLAALLSLRLPGNLGDHLEVLDSGSRGQQIFRTVRRYFARAAAQGPLVLVFEDVHWMDQSSVSLVEHILPLVRELPLLVCLCGRPEPGSPTLRLIDRARADHPGQATRIDLNALSRDESATLVANLVGADVLPVLLGQALLENAGGNPFFVEEQLRALIDLGGLTRENGGWRVTTAADTLAIPDTIQGVLTARIDRLDREPRHVLRLAAVIGRSFNRRVLGVLAGASPELDSSLVQLEESQLIEVRTRAGELVYAFKHALLQEAAYDSIPASRRRELHAQVARCIEDLFADRVDDYLSLLAYHYSRAEQWEKAQHYLFKAGDQAGKIAADAEAVAHYRSAMAAYSQVFGDRWDPVDRAALERKMGEALFGLGNHDQAREHMDRALAVLGHPFPTSPAALKRALLWQVVVQSSHRLLPSLLWKRGSRVSDRATGELCSVLSTITWIDVFGAQERTLLAGLWALNVAEAAGLDGYTVHGLMFTAGLCLGVPLPRLARRYAALAVRQARRSGQPLRISDAYFAVGCHGFAIARADSAIEAFRIAREAALVAGYDTGWTNATGQTNMLLMDQGQLQEALALAQESIGRAAETGHRLMLALGEAAVGQTLDQMGEPREAEAYVRRSLESMLAAGDLMDGLHSIGNLARVCMRQGRVNEAQGLVAKGDRLVASKPRLRTTWNTQYWTLRAEILLELAESGEGADSGGEPRAGGNIRRRDAIEQARVACKEARDCVKLYRGAAVSAYRTQGTYEWLTGRKRAAHKWWRKSIQAGERLGFRYPLAQTHLEMGRRLADRNHLEIAEKLFAEMGAALDLQVTRELLRNPGRPSR